MKFVLASKNRKKLAEMEKILGGIGYSVISQDEAGADFETEETGGTFEENARLKARAVMRFTGLPAIADDSGLMVDALSGEPGIYSARYCDGTDSDRTEKLLRNMQNIADEDRGACFFSAIVCSFPNGFEISCTGQCRGRILRETRGAGGFGYDPVFYIEEYAMTFSEMSQDIKNRISHRALALKALSEELQKTKAFVLKQMYDAEGERLYGTKNRDTRRDIQSAAHRASGNGEKGESRAWSFKSDFYSGKNTASQTNARAFAFCQ